MAELAPADDYLVPPSPSLEIKRLRERAAAGYARATEAAVHCIQVTLIEDSRVAESSSLLLATDETWTDLRDCVRQYVRLLRFAGEPPEQVLALLKRAVHSVAPSTVIRDAMLGAAIPWFLEAYYQAD